MIRERSAPSALAAVAAVGLTAVRAPSAQAHGGVAGTMSMMKGCPMTNGVGMGGHHGMTQEG